MNNKEERAAHQLWEATKQKKVCSPVREWIGENNVEAAYLVQQWNNDRRIMEGASVVGAKVGLTSKAVQQQLGVDQPDFGLLFNDMEVWNGGEVAYSQLMQPKIEAEIAFVLKKDLKGPTLGTADIISAIAYALASLEIVGSRIADWDISIADTIADNASASHFVLGHQPRKLQDLDLINCRMSLSKNGEIVSKGKGSSCMGSSLNAVLWLAQKMVALGKPLQAGDVILAGALGPMSTVEPGDQVSARIDGLGSVSVSIV